jgi:transcription elongation factor GreA-like protein
LTNSLSQEEALELLKKIAQFKKEFETPVSWKEYFNPFKVDQNFDLCIALLRSGALQKLEAAIPARQELIETHYKHNKQKIERYKAIIAANKRTNDIIKQDPLLCVV